MNRHREFDHLRPKSAPKPDEPCFDSDIHSHIDLESNVSLGRQYATPDAPVLCRRLDQEDAHLVAWHADGFKIIGNRPEQRALASSERAAMPMISTRV